MTVLRQLQNGLRLGGIDVRQLASIVHGLPRYVAEMRELKRQEATSCHRWPFGKPVPYLTDKDATSTNLGHYFWQDLWVAKRIYESRPARHVDVGSRVDGFIAHLAVFRNVEFFDVRPLPAEIPGVKFTCADLQQPLPATTANYCDSLSCLHALEHFGLGRYGDELDYEGYLKGWRNLCCLLQPGGKLYFSVPIGPQRIEFNAHRVFSVGYLMDLFKPDFRIDGFVYVDDRNYLHTNPEMSEQNIHNDFGCWMGCGIFELTKR